MHSKDFFSKFHDEADFTKQIISKISMEFRDKQKLVKSLEYKNFFITLQFHEIFFAGNLSLANSVFMYQYLRKRKHCAQ